MFDSSKSYSSIPIGKMVKPNLVILIVFIVTLALKKGSLDGWCTTLGRWQVRTNQKNGFMGAVLLFTHGNKNEPIWFSLWYFWFLRGLEGSPRGMHHSRKVIEWEEEERLIVWWLYGSFSSLYPQWKYLVILVVFLITLRLWGAPLGWRIGDTPPQEGAGCKDSIFDGFQEFF